MARRLTRLFGWTLLGAVDFLLAVLDEGFRVHVAGPMARLLTRLLGWTFFGVDFLLAVVDECFRVPVAGPVAAAPPPPLPTFRPRPRTLAAPSPPETAAPRRRAVRRPVLSVAGWTVAGAGSVLAAALFLPLAFGGRSMTVMSGSMTPAIRAGDIVIDQRIHPGQARVGDVVTFAAPGERGKLITHRVRHFRVSRNARTVSFVTRGDASNGVQRWTVPASGKIGLVRARIPKLGYAMWWVRRPWSRIVFVVVPALLLGFFEIRRIWLPRAKAPAPANA